MKRGLVVLVALAAGVGATFLAKALGFEGAISRAATFAVVLMLVTGLSWPRQRKEKRE